MMITLTGMAKGCSGLIANIFTDWGKKGIITWKKKTCAYLSVSLIVQLIVWSVCLPVCLSAGLSVFLSVHLIGYLSFCHSVRVFSEF